MIVHIASEAVESLATTHPLVLVLFRDRGCMVCDEITKAFEGAFTACDDHCLVVELDAGARIEHKIKGHMALRAYRGDASVEYKGQWAEIYLRSWRMNLRSKL